MERKTHYSDSFISPRNKSKRLKEKNYFGRFNKLNVYSHVKNNKIHVGVKPEEIYEIFNGNACGNKKSIDGGNVDEVNSIDQSTLQYYMILGMQDFHQNHYLPLRDENIVLKEELEKTQTMLMNYKKKNDERFDVIMKHLEILAERINKKYNG